MLVIFLIVVSMILQWLVVEWSSRLLGYLVLLRQLLVSVHPSALQLEFIFFITIKDIIQKLTTKWMRFMKVMRISNIQTITKTKLRSLTLDSAYKYQIKVRYLLDFQNRICSLRHLPPRSYFLYLNNCARWVIYKN